LSTKIYVKTNDGRTIPFFSMEDLRQREEQKRLADLAEKERAEAPLEVVEEEEQEEPQ